MEEEEAHHINALNRRLAELTALTDEEWQDWKATRGAPRPGEQPAPR